MGNESRGCQVEAPERINDFDDAKIYIAVADENVSDDIRKDLKQVWNYDLKNEVSYNELRLEVLKSDEEIKKHIYENVKINDCKEENILFVSYNGFSLGGIQAWTKDICEALLKDGQKNIYVMATRGDYEVPRCLRTV